MTLHPENVVKLIFQNSQIVFFIKLKSLSAIFLIISYRWSLFSRWSGKAHLPSIPLTKQDSVFSVTLLVLGTTLKWIYKNGTRFYTFSPASPASPTGPMKPTKPWNTETQCWTDEWMDTVFAYMDRRKCNYSIQEVAMSGFLTLSPMDPTFPVTPGSPYRDKYITGHLFTKINSIFLIFWEK